MEKESHIQWAIYWVDSMDYSVSLNEETLNKIKKWNIIKSKIVYLCHRGFSEENIRRMQEETQKNLFISLLSDEERKNNWYETKIIHTDDKVWLKISDRLLDILIEEKPKDFEYRYDIGGNKLYFIIDDKNKQEFFNEKFWFDKTFEYCKSLNKELWPTTWDLFESEYINVYKSE